MWVDIGIVDDGYCEIGGILPETAAFSDIAEECGGEDSVIWCLCLGHALDDFSLYDLVCANVFCQVLDYKESFL
jgi:hypothetical protein